MTTSAAQPNYVSLSWVPGTLYLVQFKQWGRTFVVNLRDILFADPQGFAPLYLLGRVDVQVSDITLSAAEQLIYDRLETGAQTPPQYLDDISSRPALRSSGLHA